MSGEASFSDKTLSMKTISTRNVTAGYSKMRIHSYIEKCRDFFLLLYILFIIIEILNEISFDNIETKMFNLLNDKIFRQRVEKKRKGKWSYQRKAKHAGKMFEKPDYKFFDYRNFIIGFFLG